MRPRYRAALGCLGVLAGALAAGVAFWPALLEGYARARVEDALHRRFDLATMSCFELDKTSLRMCEVHLEKGGVSAEVDELVVDFEASWDQVVVSRVTAKGGWIDGALEELEELRSTRGAVSAAGSGSSRLVLEDAALELLDVELALSRGDLLLTAALERAVADSPASQVELELRQLALSRGERELASASAVELVVDPDEPFPLEATVHGAAASLAKDLVVRDVAGTVTLVDESAGRVLADLSGETEAGQSWSFRGELDKSRKRVSGTLSADGMSPRHLPGFQSLPLEPDRGTVSLELSLDGSSERMWLAGSARVEGALARHRSLARQDVLLSADVELDGLEIDVGARALSLQGADIFLLRADGSRGPVALSASGHVRHADDPEARQFSFRLVVPETPCQALLEAVPPGLAPGLAGFALAGATTVDLGVSVDMADPDATVLEGGIDIDRCRVEKVPREVDALAGPFTHALRMKNGRVVSRRLGPGAAYYAALDELPAHVAGAPVATEDGGFWRHDGFLESQFRASLRRNVELGTLRRGASTITMQMVKNVLLGHEKTVSRKLQELFLTWVVERRLTKQRIMEIYLNVVEFGPGIYGVGHAAQHYFGKPAHVLTSLESAYLATLLPRPLERHEEWCRDAMTKKHASYVHAIHRRMLAKGSVSREEFDAAEADGIVFSRRGFTSEAQCLEEGRRVAEGSFTQEAISGLLVERVEFGG